MPLTGENSWRYWSDRERADAEYASWNGDAAPVLGTHFHDEGQLTLVIRGSRAFRMKSGIVHVRQGQCLYIPAGWPHRGLPHFDRDTRCINTYVSLPSGRHAPVLFSVPEITAFSRGTSASLLARAVRCLPPSAGDELMGGYLPRIDPRDDACVGEIASRYGLSRETFTRSFSRGVGMPPHAFRIVSRLNLARRQIRAGETLAAVAVEQGFADQSHLGRHFRRVFGVTPETYREAMR
jgi:AraC-like DNA-binding protein